MAGENHELAAKMLRMFLSELPNHRSKIEHAYAAHGCAEPLRDAVHKLHGSAAYVCAFEIKDCAKQLENAVVENRAEEIDRLLQRLMQAMDTLEGMQETLLGELSG